MFSLKEYRQPTNRLPDYLPWAALVAPGVILQKDRLLQKTISFRGPDLASSSGSELVSSVARLNNALKRLGSGWSFFIEAQRFQKNDFPQTSWTNPVGWLVDMERKNQFEHAGAHFESNYFCTFVWLMPGIQTKKAEQIFYEDPNKNDQALSNQRDIDYFLKTCYEIIDIMIGVFADVNELDDNQTLTYLHSTISTNKHQVIAPETPMYIDALIPDQAFTPGDVPMLGNNFIPTCTFMGFPSTSFPGILDDLNHLDLEYRWVTRYICLDKEDAKKHAENYRKRWWAKRKTLFTMLKEEASKQESQLLDTEAAVKAADADSALQEIGEDLVSFGYFTATVTVWHEDINEALKRLQRVKGIIQSHGFTVKDETLNSKEAWLGSLPGHVYANVRRPLISSLNLAHIMPLSAIWSGEQENGHLKKVCGAGPPHIVCSTTGGTPFRLNFNVGDVGHGAIFGPTGAGKSTLLCMLELQWLKYPSAQVVIFDKDRSARAATLSVGGVMYEPGNEDNQTKFQPLAHVDDPNEFNWALQFILTLLQSQNVEETPELKKEVYDALISISTDHIENRTLTVFSALVQNTTIRAALQPYTIEGPFGSIFDGDRDDVQDVFWQMFEMNHLMRLGDAAIIPALFYLFHRVEKLFDGSPTLLILDECWYFLKHPVFMNQLQNWLKTLRKKNVYCIFATQEISDAADSAVMPTILSACHTKIYLPDDEALTPAMAKAYDNFGLTDTEILLLANATKKRDYYYRSTKGRRMFDLNMGEVALTFAASSSEADHQLMDSLLKDHSDNHIKFAQGLLNHKGLPLAAELLEKAFDISKRDKNLKLI